MAKEVDESSKLDAMLDDASKDGAQATRFPETFDIKPAGARITGIVKRVALGIPTPNSGYNKVGDVIEIEKLSDGKRVGIWLPTVLRSHVVRMDIKEGDKVGIVSVGKPEGKQYVDFRVVKL